jgi:DNA-binding transcriptional regulator YiaG
MPNIASALKQEIARVARKEFRRETEATQKAMGSYRHQIAELKRRLADLERQVKSGSKQRRSSSTQDTSEERPSLRFRPDGLRKHRERLGLSAADAGKIMGVSALSVYKWESGKTRPRAAQLQKIADLRGLGKRETQRRLSELA